MGLWRQRQSKECAHPARLRVLKMKASASEATLDEADSTSVFSSVIWVC